MTTTKENAVMRYTENINYLDNLNMWSEAEIAEFKKNGKQEIEKYGWHYVALDYNSYIIVLKYLLKRS